MIGIIVFDMNDAATQNQMVPSGFSSGLTFPST
jgi:hypothetical protein